MSLISTSTEEINKWQRETEYFDITQYVKALYICILALYSYEAWQEKNHP